jgi:exodeoxyribonuclease V gamma subunit
MLHIHRSERADALVEALSTLLTEPLPDPFAAEIVAVPARGVERWVTQRLSHHLGTGAQGSDGVCANVVFPSPARIVADVTSAASGIEPDEDPWAEGRVVWTLLDVIEECASEPWCAVLARHLGAEGADTGRPRGRLMTAQHLGHLYASYAAQRPDLLRDWTRGMDTDGAGAPLDEHLVWQAELWRRLCAAIPTASPAERLPAACDALRVRPELVDLPGRLSLFGPTRVTSDQATLLAALAEHRDVHLWLLHPSADLWAATTPVTAAGGRLRRRDDLTVKLALHPLLLSLGRDSRELQLIVASATTPATDTYHRGHRHRDTLLGLLQRDISTNTAPPGAPLGGAPDARALLGSDDRSLQVHACHGRDRQVEVVREVLLSLFEADPSLEPRDVLVMCPDIEAYAPYISATFGLADVDRPPAHPGHRLRVRLADRSLRQTNPLLSVVAELLELADARVTASQVLDIAAAEPVRRRFGFDEDSLDRIRGWVSSSGVRWGLDAAHRAPFSMQAVTQNTWRAGLDRLLLGVTMSGDDLHWLGLALPLDDVDSFDVDLVGRFSELVDRLSAVVDSLSGPASLVCWLDTLADALDALTEVPQQSAWQRSQARRELADIAQAAGERAETVSLSLADVRSLLGGRLKGRPTRAGFRTGDLTMCSMVPMRSVPHRVICLLGLDDGVFPRSPGVDGDDVLARDPCVGERDRRSEDRQLLLDAVLAAQDSLVIVYTGADERTNSPRPPAVPVGEILDVVDATVRSTDGRPAHDHVVVRHPLQPFDARNFEAGRLGTKGPFSFDPSALAGAHAAARPRRAEAPFLAGPLSPADATTAVELGDLTAFLEHPVKQFLRQRLGVTVPEDEQDVDDALHAELGPLPTWAVGDRWLRTRLAGADMDACEQAEWRRGELPPGNLGVRLLEQITGEAEPLLAASAADRATEPFSVDIAVTLPSGRLVSGSVAGVHGTTLSSTVFSKLGPKYRLRAWLRLLALAAARPEQQWRAVTIGRHSRPGVARSTMVAPAPPVAEGCLAAYVELRERGLREPLALPVATGAAYADVRHTGNDEQAALDAAERAWKGAFEARDRYHEFVWGPEPAFTGLLAQRATADDQPMGATDSERTRFGALACRLWWPLLAAETLETP